MDMGRRVRQVLLLCALALAVLGMHHLAFAPHGTSHEAPATAHAATAMPMDSAAPMELPAAQSPRGSGTGAGHDLMHLCLAVLCAAGGFLLAWLLLAVSAGTPARPGRPRQPVWRGWRLPGPAGRSLLAAVCVLRI